MGSMFEAIKVAKTGIKQLNFINMPKYTCHLQYIFPAFQTFGSILL